MMYSPETLNMLARDRRRLRLRRLRLYALLLVLLVVVFWGYANWRADNFTFAWDRSARVILIAIMDPNTDFEEESRQGFLQRFLHGPLPGPGNVAGVRKWFQEEFHRHTGKDDYPLEFVVRGPLRASRPPPPIPCGEESFLRRWRRTRDFLAYFEKIGRDEGLVLDAYDVAIFVYLYDESELNRYALHQSIASRRNQRGVVFSPLGPDDIARCSTHIAHELCHTLGATDKYRGDRSVFPQGFADPNRNPPYPQEYAEIMALAIPVAPGREIPADDLGDCVVGARTAEEMGWKDSPD